MAALVVEMLPEGPEWLYELKFDGYRALLIKHEEMVRLHSRKDKDLTAQYPGIVSAGEHLDADLLVLDGEIVALAEDGRPSFQALQHRSAHASHTIVYYAFDVLQLEGRDLTTEATKQRRSWLPTVVGRMRRFACLRPAGRGGGRRAGRAGDRRRGRHRQAKGLDLSGRRAIRRLGEVEARKAAGVRDRGISTRRIGQPRRAPGRVRPGEELLFAGKVRAGFIPPVRREVIRNLKPLRVASARSPTCRTTRNRVGVPASRLRRCARCSGQGHSSSRRSDSLSSPPMAAYVTPHSLGCARTKRREK